jgi:hypothetical protein
LFILFENHIEESLDAELTIEILGKLIERYGIWLSIEKDRVVAFFIIGPEKDIYGREFCYISQFFIRKGKRRTEFPREVFNSIVDWAKEKKLKKILFMTRRDPMAFSRLVGCQTKIEEVMLSVCV